MISAENVDEGPAASCWLWMEEPPSGSSAFWVDVGLTKWMNCVPRLNDFLVMCVYYQGARTTPAEYGAD